MDAQTKSMDRRHFLQATAMTSAALAAGIAWGQGNPTIKDIRIKDAVEIEAEDGTTGRFQGRHSALGAYLERIRELWVGRDPFDLKLEGAMLWQDLYPGKARLYAEGRDPLTGEVIANKPREDRHSKTGRVFMAFSAVDIALWDLRGKLAGKPTYQVMSTANRKRVLVYWRPGEPDKGLDDARRRARDAYDRGYHYQKWYFTRSAKDGDVGMKQDIELVRVLREELPDCHLMFDNHSIRYYADVDYSVRLCKAIAEYKPFWVEEPICPEHVDGYARIKGETGVTIAGGEHCYTRWQVKPFLERNCVDYVQSDPVWCGGISEWLRICRMVEKYPGVKVVPHITSPWIVTPHCVASQSAALCPLLEFNYQGGRKALEDKIGLSSKGQMLMTMPTEPGIS
jgi:L-rhamnonate dehydratase